VATRACVAALKGHNSLHRNNARGAE